MENCPPNECVAGEGNIRTFHPIVLDNPTGWGPATTPEMFKECLKETEKYPFEVSLQVDRLSRACDFTAWNLERQKQQALRRGRPEPSGPTAFGEESQFLLVDTRPLPKPKARHWQSRKPQNQRGGREEEPRNAYQRTQKDKRQNDRRFNDRYKTFREWSVTVRPEWRTVSEVTLASLTRQNLDSNAVKVTDLKWFGELGEYMKSYDRVNEKTKKMLQSHAFKDLQFYRETTSSDPILKEILANKEAQVIATDTILSTLITAAKSVYSWDLIVIKDEGRIIIDRREDDPDYYTCNENATEPPAPDAKPEINQPLKLAKEATIINLHFSQQVLDSSKPPVKMGDPCPFVESPEEKPATCAYRYRSVVLPGTQNSPDEHARQPITLAVRATIDCQIEGGPSLAAPTPITNSKGQPKAVDDSKAAADGTSIQYCSVKALNEYNPKLGRSWRKSLESQQGAALADEIRNNSKKLGRWVAEGLIGGVDVLKLGFVSRVTPDLPTSHQILSCQSYNLKNFAAQIGMTQDNAWGTVRAILDVILAQEDGKYLLIKDPNKAALKLYSIDWEDFAPERDDSDESDSGEGDNDADDERDGTAEE